jgi:CRISPR-associated protein Cas1
MGTPSPLLSKIANPRNLAAAWLRVGTKRRAGGSDGVGVEDFARRTDENLRRLGAEILAETYTPEPLLNVSIAKGPHTRERRTLGLPSVRDKVAQEAARRVLEPILSRGFLDCSYGYREGKGPQKAIRRVSDYIGNRKRGWVVLCDVDDFFGSLDHGLLLRRLGDTLKDPGAVRLLELWLRMGTVDARGRWRDVFSGVGQGAVVSPLLANFYLHPFDAYLTGLHPDFGLVRYSDDFVTLTPSRAQAEEALAKTVSFLASELSLRLNAHDRPVCSVDEGFTFLGLRFAGGELGIDPDKLEKIRSKLRSLCGRLGAEPLEKSLRAINEALAGWRRYYGALVAPEEFRRVEAMLLEALPGALPRCFQRGVLRSAREAIEALGRLDLAGTSDPRARRRLAQQVLRNSRPPRPGPPSEAAAARNEAPGAEQARPKANGERGTPPAGADGGPGLPAEGREAPAAATRTGAEPAPPEAGARAETEQPARRPGRPRSAAAAVRSKKRAHALRQAEQSELVLTVPGSFLGKSGERLVVRRDRRIVFEAPALQVRSVTVAEHGVSLSSDVVAHCASHGIPLVFIEHPGRVSALLTAPQASPAEVQLRQLRAHDDPDRSVVIARQFVLGKVKNQRNLALYLGKYHAKATPKFAEALEGLLAGAPKLLAELKALPRTADDGYRGRLFSIEGRFASLYWAVFGAALNGKTEFPGRRREGARDLVNALLNYGYAVLASRVHLALVQAGLNPHVSFLHTIQDGKPTLVYDLMEEFRPQVVDRTVLALLTRREKLVCDGGGRLTLETRKLLLKHLFQRLASIVRFRGKELKLQEILQHQARLLSGHLKGQQRYRPFVGKW